MSPRICLALAALIICLCPLTANAQASRIKGYAVQVAALSSRKSADELIRGLSARGIPAYSVGGVSYGASQIHRVRVGNFLTILSANTYAEKLLGAGLLGSYAIAAYESPSKAGFISNGSNGKVQTFAQKQSGKRFMPEVIDVIAAIGSRGWLLLSSESIKLTAREGDSDLSRELSKLAAVLNSRGWSLNNNISKILASPAPLNVATLSKGIIANAPPPSRASSSPSNAPAFEVAREDLIPGSSTSIGSPVSRSRIFDSGPRLQGSIEMRGGRMFMTLRNSDPEKGFIGVARISLSDDSKQQDVTPIQFTLPPDREMSFPVNEATLTDGAWILMVYDQNGAARLIRGASLAPPKTLAQAPTDSTVPVDPNPAQQTPPSYVTGVYDTTTWTQPQAPPQVQNIETQDVLVSEAANTQNGAVDIGAAGSPNQASQVETGPGQVAAALRQIAITKENVTLELVLSAQNSIKNVTITLRAGDFQDVRQTFIPTSQGSVPFLLPIAYASAGIYYEVKDEAQRVLANGASDLRSLDK